MRSCKFLFFCISFIRFIPLLHSNSNDNLSKIRLLSIKKNYYFSLINLKPDNLNQYKLVNKEIKNDLNTLIINSKWINEVQKNTDFLTLNSEFLTKLIILQKYYEKPLKKILENYPELPNSFVYLPLIISGYNHSAKSQTGGYGFWLMNYPTAIKNNLKIGPFTDQRANFVLSSKAAIKEIYTLYKTHKDLNYALIHFLYGPKTANLYKNRIIPLPEKFKNFTTIWASISYIITYYNYSKLLTDNQLPQEDTLIEAHYKTTKTISLDDLKKYINIKKIKFLNPELCQNIIPKGYPLKCSKKTKYFLQNKWAIIRKKVASSTKKQQTTNILYTVEPGDVLGKIAAQYNVSINQLIRLNNIKGTTIYVNQKLKIKTNTSTLIAKKSTPKKLPINSSKANYKIYIIQPGDNLWDIAKNYPKVSADDLIKWNNVSENIFPGQKLKIKQL